MTQLDPPIATSASWLQRGLRLFKRQNVFLLFSLSALLLHAVSMLGAIVVLRWVSPASMGIWQTILLAQAYAEVMQLGVLRGLNHELPFLLGQGDIAAARHLAATAQFHSVLVGSLGALGFFVALLFTQAAANSSEWRYGLVAMALVWSAGNYHNYLEATFRAQNKFKHLAYAQLIEAGLQVVTLYLVVVWGYQGMLVRAVILTLFMTVILFWMQPMPLWPKFRWKAFRQLLYTGIPLYGIGYLYVLAIGFDRIILLQTGGTELIGFYAPMAAVMAAMTVGPQAIIAYLYPRLSFSLGKGGASSQLWRKSLQAFAASVVISIPMVLVGWFVIPLAMEHLFPDYLPALTAVRLMLIVGFLLSGRAILVPLYSLKAWHWLYLYMGIFTLTRWLLLRYFAFMYEPLLGVAIGGVVAGILMLIIALGISWQATKRQLV